MSQIEITEVVPCPDMEMDTSVDDCCGCEWYEGRDNDSINCNFNKKKGSEK